MADHMFRQWTKFYHGLFDDNVLSSNVTSGSRQDSFCLGSTPLSIIHSRSVFYLQSMQWFFVGLFDQFFRNQLFKIRLNVKSASLAPKGFAQEILEVHMLLRTSWTSFRFIGGKGRFYKKFIIVCSQGKFYFTAHLCLK